MTGKFKIVAFLFLLVGMKAVAQPDFPLQINQQLNNYLINNLQEKIYVQTNSNEYVPGDTIWFKASLVNAITHTPAGAEKLIYVDLVAPDNKIACHQVFYVFNGFSAGCLPVYNSLDYGTYKLVAYTNYMKNYSSGFFFQKNIDILQTNNDQIYWEFNPLIRSHNFGDSVSVTMQAVKNDGREINSDVNVRVQLAGGAVLGETCHISGNSGRFNFFIPDSLRLPEVLLTLNFPYEKNSKASYKIKLSDVKPDLQFLPESGNLISGTDNLVAFKCIDKNGAPLEIYGRVYDRDHQFVTNFQAAYRGMGTLHFIPSFQSGYTAEVKLGNKIVNYQLPAVRNPGYGIHFVKEKQDSLVFMLLQSEKTKTDFTFMGHTRGLVKYLASGYLDTAQLLISIPKAMFTSGIAVFTLFVNNYPQAERLVYIKNNDQLTISIDQDKQEYEKRDRVGLSVTVTDDQGMPVKGSFSLNAYDTEKEQSLNPLENIQDYLLFTSDLQGTIFPDIGLFDQTDSCYDNHVDLVMLTNGWRRFFWPDVFDNQEKEKQYTIEKGLRLKGEVRRMINQKPVPKNFEVSLVFRTKQSVFIEEAKTDEFGRFEIGLPEFIDSARVVIQTKNRLNQQNDYLINLQSNIETKRLNALSFDKVSTKPVDLVIPAYLGFKQQKSLKISALHNNLKERVDNYYFPGKDTFLIEEVEVKSDFLSQRDSMIYQTGDPDVVIGSTQLKKMVEEKAWYNNLWDLLQDQVPGLYISQQPYNSSLAKKYNLVITSSYDNSGLDSDETTNFENRAVYFRVKDNPDGQLYIIVDGDFLTNNGSVKLYDFLTYMNPTEIESINFIAKPKHYENAEFINRSDNSNGFSLRILEQMEQDNQLSENIFDKLQANRDLMDGLAKSTSPPSFLFITTQSKKGIFYKRSKGIASLYLNGFSKYREFYSLKYQDKENSDNKIPDFRKTIAWDPNIVTDSTGKASVSFYTSDSNNPVAIQIQGLSVDGKTGTTFFNLNGGKKPADRQVDPEILSGKKELLSDTADYSDFHLIKGIVTHHGVPLSFVDIVQTEPYYHVSANNQGEFLIDEDRLSNHSQVIVSCPGFVDQEISEAALSSGNLRIELVKASVSAASAMRDAEDIVKKAIKSSRKYYASEKVYQGYFRETISVGTSCYGIHESVFNYTNKGWAGYPESLLFETEKFKNMEDKNGHKLLILKPNHRSKFYPLNTDVLSMTPEFWDMQTLKEFDFVFAGEVKFSDQLCYKIRFAPKENIIFPLQKGVMYIEKESFALRSVQWEISPETRQYLGYTVYLQSNPIDYHLSVQHTYYEASYAFRNNQLILQSTKDRIEVLVNQTDVLKFDCELSVTGENRKSFKEIENSTFDSLIDEGKGTHFIVKDAEYIISSWINRGIIKPETNLIHDAKYMHDITFYR